MYYGVTMPNFGVFADPALLVTLAQEAEKAGWDGFFLWDHIALGSHAIPMVEPWAVLAAIAVKTQRMHIGPMVTPLPRRRPTQIAREAVTIDHLSGGRLILGVGAGTGYAWDQIGEAADAKIRAVMLDEALEVITGLWQGKPFTHHGKYFDIEETVFLPTPLRTTGIPIWVAGIWPKKAPFRRAARWQGIVPSLGDYSQFFALETIAEMSMYINGCRDDTAPFDVVIRPEHRTGMNVEQDRLMIEAYKRAGVTWWLENIPLGSEHEWSVELTRERICKGPPTVW